MNVLIACEESQVVCKSFRNQGHNAFSCDILECSGGHPEWHIKGDCIPLLNGECSFLTMDGKEHKQIGSWDLIIAHPPCTYLSISGNSWFNISKYGKKAKERYIERYKAIIFFMKIADAKCDKICIENPIGIMSTAWKKPNQIIQPFMFGHATRKATCLWLKNLPCLISTDVVEPEIIVYKNGKGTDSAWHMESLGLVADERRRIRSKTFQGIAEAMATQWG